MSKTVLELKGVSKSYGVGSSRIAILNKADLTVGAGEVVALIGPSGSGKSTLLYLAGLLDKADGGRVFVDGRDATAMSDNARTRLRAGTLGFVYQSHNLFPDFTAQENVALSLMVAGAGRDAAMAKSAEYLTSLGLKHRLTHRLAELSGGEAQRVAIARAFVRRPKLLLADEPTGNLDPMNSDEVFGLLMDLVKDTGMSAIVATHNPALAHRMHRRVVLFEGSLVDIGVKDGGKALMGSPVGRKILDSFS